MITAHPVILACCAGQAFLRGESGAVSAYELSQLADMNSSMNQEATLLEREVTNYWLAHFFQAEKSKMKNRSWEALLLMWMRAVSHCIVTVFPCVGTHVCGGVSTGGVPA